EPSWSGAPYGYRSRARIAISESAIGYRKRDSREIIDVEVCVVLDEARQAELVRLRASKPRRGEKDLGPSIFQQSNMAGNAAMIAHVEALAQGAKKVLELYAGSGNFTRVLPGEVHAIESNADAVKSAPMPIEHAPVEDAMHRLKPGFD